MRNLSLKWKSILGGTIPLILFLGLVTVIGFTNYKTYSAAEKLQRNSQAVDVASDLVHELQKERGLSVSFLRDNKFRKALNGQRDLVLRKIEVFKKIKENTSFSPDKVKYFSGLESSIEKIRSHVDGKSPKLSSIFQIYNEIISQSLSVEVFVANKTLIPNIAGNLKSLRILEHAKESAALLLTKMTTNAAREKIFSDEELKEIFRLKNTINSNLESYGLDLRDSTKLKVDELRQSDAWNELTRNLDIVLGNKKLRVLEVDPERFLSKTGSVFDDINKIVVSEKRRFLTEVAVVKGEAFSKIWQLTLFAITSSFLALLVLFKISSSISKVISSISYALRDESEAVTASSIKMENLSSELSDAATKQASSLQETVSSIDEISSMIERNSDSANMSTEVSKKSNDTAQIGKEKIEHMIVSINEISESNSDIMVEMESNNNEITRIIKLISEIGDKTKVINDIVFQTKLLSFNASVEAARAGEHGKGFAVVAEEVGNLASMSGKAALEITEMLDSSIKQVTQIVENSKSKITALVHVGKEKVESGKVVAAECGDVLDEILQNVSSVNEMVREISTASSEQSTGVREVTMAMQQLDEVAHLNTSSANESADAAKGLKKQASRLNEAVIALNNAINGDKVKSEKKIEKKVQEKQDNPSKVIEMKKIDKEVTSATVMTGLKVVGSDVTIPDESDPRFEDL